MKRTSVIFFTVCSAFLFTQAALADHITTLYGNSFGSDGIRIYSVDVDTGVATLTDHITQGGGANQIQSGNGRGVVTVGSTIYYTYASSGSVYSYNLATHTNNGSLFSVAGASGLSTAAWDGSHLILGDYSGTNQAYFYTTGGVSVNTIHLNSCTSFCDGLEFANGGLVSNEGDETANPYDKYAIGGGAPTVSAFISPGAHAANNMGIAYDGTYYFISEGQLSRLGVYDNTGAFVKEISVAGSNFEDLSVDYNLVLPPPTVPEPFSALLLLPALAAVGFRLRKRLV